MIPILSKEVFGIQAEGGYFTTINPSVPRAIFSRTPPDAIVQEIGLDYRTNDKKEIDFIVEKGETIFAMEVKSSQSVKKNAFKHIADFQKKSFGNIIGIVFYAGDTILWFGDDHHQRYAVPMNIFF